MEIGVLVVVEEVPMNDAGEEETEGNAEYRLGKEGDVDRRDVWFGVGGEDEELEWEPELGVLKFNNAAFRGLVGKLELAAIFSQELWL